jgi:hypothetical protein
VLAALGYVYYNRWQRITQQHTTVLPPILSHSAIVFSFKTIGQGLEKLQHTTIGNDLQAMPWLRAIQHIEASLIAHGLTKEQLDKLPLFVSLHDLPERPWQAIFYFDIRQQPFQVPFREVLAKLQGKQTKYGSQTIFSLSAAGTDKGTLYYLLPQKDYIVLSAYKPLIEEMANAITTKNTTAFLANQSISPSHSIPYIHLKKIARRLGKALKPNQGQKLIECLTNWPPPAQLAYRITTDCLLLSGHLAKQTSSPDSCCWIEAIASAKPRTITPARYIPAQAAAVQYYTFDDPTTLSNQYKAYLAKQAGPVAAASQAMETTEKEKTLNELLKHDITYCLLGPTLPDAMMLLHVADPAAAIDILQENHLLAACLSQRLDGNSTVYSIDTAHLKSWLPHLLFPSFVPTVLTVVDNYLVLANSFNTLLQVCRAYTRGYTWDMEAGASQSFLASLETTANFSFFINLQQAWPLLQPFLQPTWKSWCEENLAAFLQTGFLGIQLSHLPSSAEKQPAYAINAVLKHEAQPMKALPAESSALLASTCFQTQNSIITMPFAVKTHKAKGLHWLVQDAAYQLYFIDAQGKLIWKKQLEGPIRTPIFTVDYYNNKKCQYLCSTSEALHIIDYAGKEVKAYPQKLPKHAEKIKLAIVDYEGNKDYRFLIADEKGSLYIKNKQYASLSGWNPKALQGAFATPPLHVRIKNDYFISLQENGLFYLFNRKGELQPPFPIDLGTTLHNPLIVKPAPTLAASHVVLLTDEGQLLRYNLVGHCTGQLTLSKTPETLYFILTPNSQQGQDYAIFRQDRDKITVWDAAGKLLFEKNYTSEKKLLYQYSTWGHQQLYIITDPSTSATYIYDEVGTLLHDTPLDNSGKPIQAFFTAATEQLTIYTSFEHTVRQYQFIITKRDIAAKQNS